MAAVAGLRATGDFGTDERPKSFREMIMFRNPKGTAPIFALTSRARKRTVEDAEYNWWDENTGIVRLQVAGEHAASATTITVDSSDPSTSSPAIAWGLATHLKPGDLLQVEATESDDYDAEFVQVESVLSDTQFTVTRGAANSTAATISDDAYLTLVGSAYAEGTAAPNAISRNPTKYYNYCQIFKDTYEISGTTEVTKLRTGDAWSNDKKRKTFDHARGIEWSILYGRRHEGTGANGKPLRYMGGLRTFIPGSRVTVFSSAVTVNTFLDAVYPVFDYDTGAGDERIAFCGNGALNALNKVIQADSNSDITFAGPVEVFGMNFNQFVMPQGRLFLKTHPLMNMHGKYTNSMFVVDFASLNYVHMKGRDTKPKDNVQAEDEDVRRGYFLTECGIEVLRGGLTMAYLGNISDS